MLGTEKGRCLVVCKAGVKCVWCSEFFFPGHMMVSHTLNNGLYIQIHYNDNAKICEFCNCFLVVVVFGMHIYCCGSNGQLTTNMEDVCPSVK